MWRQWLELWDLLWFRCLTYVLVVYTLWCGFVWRYQDKFILPAPQRDGPPPSDFAGELWTIDIPGGQVHAQWYPTWSTGPPVVVVLFHGNGETIERQGWWAEGYRARGCQVLLPEYRGYGHADGKAGQRAMRADLVRFYDRLLEQPGVTPERIVFHGRSLGGGAAAMLAAERRPAAMILESTFTSIAGYFKRYGVPTLLCRHPFRTERVVRELDLPILVLHGDRDIVVPIEEGRRLAAIAPRARLVEFEAGHNDLPGIDGEVAYWRAIEELLAEAGSSANRW